MPFQIDRVILILSLYCLAACRDCYVACDDTPIDYDKEICYSDCDLRLIVGATVGSFVGLSILVILLCCCSFINKRCLYFIRKKLIKKFNQVDAGKKTKLQFEKDTNDIVNSLKKSEFINSFYYAKKVKKFKLSVNCQSLILQPIEEFLIAINFSGCDHEHGNFVAEGFFLMRKGEPFFWFMLRYEPYDLAEKRGMEQIIVFESVKITKMALIGLWSFVSNIQQSSEEWFLVFRVQDQNKRLVDAHNVS